MSAVESLQRNGRPDKHNGRVAEANLRRVQRAAYGQLQDVGVVRVLLRGS